MGSWNAIVLDLCFSIHSALTSQPRVLKGCHGKWLGREGATLTPRLSVSGGLREPSPCRALSLYRFAAANQSFCCAKASGNLCCALVFHEQRPASWRTVQSCFGRKHPLRSFRAESKNAGRATPALSLPTSFVSPLPPCVAGTPV